MAACVRSPHGNPPRGRKRVENYYVKGRYVVGSIPDNIEMMKGRIVKMNAREMHGRTLTPQATIARPGKDRRV
jgi:hypothetical protein